MKKLVFIMMVLLGVTAFTLPSYATSFTLYYDFEFSGAYAPVGDAPWLQVTVDDEGTAGSVKFTFEDVGLTDDEAVGDWLFNLNPAKTVDSWSPISGDVPVAIYFNPDAYNADGDGYFDLKFDFNKNFGVGSTAVLMLYDTDIVADDFYFLSLPKEGEGNPGPFYSAAHVQSIDTAAADDAGSGWVAGHNGTQVPEPMTLLLLGLGLVGVAGIRRRIK